MGPIEDATNIQNIRRSKKIKYMSPCTEMYRRIFFTMYGNVPKKLFRKSFGWLGALDAIFEPNK